jgi:hypothetical protein
VKSLVLKKTPYGDSDLIVTMVVETGRILKGFAAGARKSRKRFPHQFAVDGFYDVDGMQDDRLARLHRCDLIHFNDGIGKSCDSLCLWAQVAEWLVRLANLQTDSNGTTRATHLTPVATSTTKRTRTYQVGQNIGAAIRELSDIENGFDITVDPTSREIEFVPNTSFTDQTDIAYGYNTLPRNLDDVVVNDDGTTKANSINVQGAFIVGNTDSPTDIADVGIILEDWLSASDIKDEAIVGAYANEEIVFRVDGQMTIAAKPSPGAPMPYIDYEWGDKVYISANKGRMQLDRQAARVFSGRISWNSQNEAILDELGITP